MPGLVKIGKTVRNAGRRAHELFQTGVPTPFEVAHSVFSPDCHVLENQIHGAMRTYRVSDAREFFQIDTSAAISVVDTFHQLQVWEWTQRYLPDFELIERNAAIKVADLQELAEAIGRPFHDVARALSFLTPNDIRPALDRFDELRRKLRVVKDG